MASQLEEAVANAICAVSSDIFGEVMNLIEGKPNHVIGSDVLNPDPLAVSFYVVHDPIVIHRLEFPIA